MTDGKTHRNSRPTFETQLRALKESRFHPGKTIEVPVPILQLKNVAICTAGNISNIQGPAKSAKSSVMGAAIASILRALMGKPDCDTETLGFTSKLPRNDEQRCGQILHFDTEQSSYHHHKLCMDILSRADVTPKEYESLPFHSYSLVTTDISLRQRIIKQLVAEIRNGQPKGSCIACLFLDGVADIISDPNNAEESFGVVNWLHGFAEENHCAVITILHENPGEAGKARGHLGSQIIRKSETNLRVLKGGKGGKGGVSAQDDAVSVIWVERARGAHIKKDDGVSISWCSIKNRHTTHHPAMNAKISAPKDSPGGEPRSSSLTQKQQRTKFWLETKALPSPKSHTELVQLAMKQPTQPCENRTAKKRINEWVSLGWIHKTGAGQAPYALGPEPTTPNDVGDQCGNRAGSGQVQKVQ